MVRTRLIVAVFAAAFLLAAPASWSSPAVVSATGRIAGSGTSYTLTVTNTGTQDIKCIALFVPASVTVTGAQGPSGWFVGTSSDRKILGGQSDTQPIKPGASATFTFTTAAEYPANAGGELHVSADCIGDVISRATGPGAPEPCKCLRLEGAIVPRSVAFVNPGERGGMHMQFVVSWTMSCTTGSGSCNGQLELFPPQPALKLGARLKPIGGRIACKGPCAATSGGSKKFTLIGGRALGFDRRGKTIKSIKLRMQRTCQGVRTSDRVFTIVFTKPGSGSFIDKKKSDLNADGKPDGRR